MRIKPDWINYRVYTTRQAADFLGLSIRALERWRKVGIGPEYIKVSPTCIRYEVSKIHEWMKKRSIKPAIVDNAS